MMLILRAQNRINDESIYYESHHIIPKCMGGTDDKSNLVLLAAEEHYTAHLLLVKMYPNESGLLFAANVMTTHSTNNRSRNKSYGWLRRQMSDFCKTKTGAKNNSFGRPWYHNPLTGEAGKFETNQQPNGWLKGRVPERPNSKCNTCGNDTGKKKAKYCEVHRAEARVGPAVIRQKKLKKEYTDQEKLEALRANNGNIRKALYSLGLNDSGWHYKKMKHLNTLAGGSGTKSTKL